MSDYHVISLSTDKWEKMEKHASIFHACNINIHDMSGRSMNEIGSIIQKRGKQRGWFSTSSSGKCPKSVFDRRQCLMNFTAGQFPMINNQIYTAPSTYVYRLFHVARRTIFSLFMVVRRKKNSVSIECARNSDGQNFKNSSQFSEQNQGRLVFLKKSIRH